MSYQYPHVEQFNNSHGRESESQPLLGLVEASDVLVVLVAHRTVDWQMVYERAGLVVDTAGTARHRELRPDQVLLLGRGWIRPGRALEPSATGGTTSPIRAVGLEEVGGRAGPSRSGDA